jgi:hypothetical protein
MHADIQRKELLLDGEGNISKYLLLSALDDAH